MMLGAGRSAGRNVIGLDGRTLVQRAAQRIDHAAEQAWAHRNLHHATAARDALARAHAVGLVEQHAGDVIGLQTGGIAHAAFGKVQQLIEPHTGQARDLGNAVGHAVHATDFLEYRRGSAAWPRCVPRRPSARAPAPRRWGRSRSLMGGLVACSARAAASSADQLCESTPCSKCSSAPRSSEGRVSALQSDSGASKALGELLLDLLQRGCRWGRLRRPV